MLGRCQTDPFFPSPQKGAESHVMLGKQLDQGLENRLLPREVNLSKPLVYLIKGRGWEGGEENRIIKAAHLLCT